MAVNALMPRWVKASIAKHLHTYASGATLPFVVEGMDVKERAFVDSAHKAEATISGPFTREVNGFVEIRVDVAIVITSHDAGSDKLAHEDKAGVMANALDRCIEVKNYGPGVDSPSLIGTLQPRREPNDTVSVQPVKPEDTNKLKHTVVDVRYTGLFPRG